MKEENTKPKSKAKKLTDTIVRSYNRLDTIQIIPGDFSFGIFFLKIFSFNQAQICFYDFF